MKTLYYLILRKKSRILYYYFDTRFYVNFLHVWWHKKDIFLLIFIVQNCQNVHWILKKTSIFQDLMAIQLYFKMNYDIHRQVTNNSLGSHEYRHLRQCWIIPSKKWIEIVWNRIRGVWVFFAKNKKICKEILVKIAVMQ